MKGAERGTQKTSVALWGCSVGSLENALCGQPVNQGPKGTWEGVASRGMISRTGRL